MATVRKRRWTYQGEEKEAWILTYTDQGGKRRQETYPKKKDADRRRIEVENEIEAGTHTAINESVTVDFAMNDFIETCEKRRRMHDMTGRGVAAYREKSKAIVARFAKRKICELTPDDIQIFVDELTLKYKPSTVVGFYQTVSVLLSHSVKKKWVKRNVLKDVKTRLPKREKRTAIPSKSDISLILKRLEKMESWENLETFISRKIVACLGVFGGLRPGETFGLQWEDIDFKNSVIHIRHSYCRYDGLKDPKSEAGIRDIPITEPIREALEAAALYWTCKQWAHGEGFRSYSRKAFSNRIKIAFDTKRVAIDYEALTGFVLMTKARRPRISEHSHGIWNRLMRDVGLYNEKTRRPKFTMHALRHAAASLFIEAGLPAMNLKTVIGHASVSTTYDVYGHLFPEDQRIRNTAEQIAASFNATREQQNDASN